MAWHTIFNLSLCSASPTSPSFHLRKASWLTPANKQKDISVIARGRGSADSIPLSHLGANNGCVRYQSKYSRAFFQSVSGVYSVRLVNGLGATSVKLLCF